MAKKEVDWLSVEVEYRAGLKSLRVLGEEFGISEGAIRKKAKEKDWCRDLSKKIEAETERKVQAAAVENRQRPAKEAEVIEANADLQTQVILQHRHDLKAARELVTMMLTELSVATTSREAIEQLAATLLNPEDDKSAMDAIMALVSLPERAKAVKALSDSLKNMVMTEREVYGLNKEQKAISEVDKLLRQVHEAE
jgi:hypothetical protein